MAPRAIDGVLLAVAAFFVIGCRAAALPPPAVQEPPPPPVEESVPPPVSEAAPEPEVPAETRAPATHESFDAFARFGSVVRVRVLTGLKLRPDGGGEMVRSYEYGTAVLLFESGLLVTAAHVVRRARDLPEGAYGVDILTFGGRQYSPAEVLVTDPKLDVALLQVNPRVVADVRPVELATSLEGTATGEVAYAVGIRAGAAPQDFEVGLLRGRFVDVVSKLRELGVDTASRERHVGISQEIFPGYSGGAILDATGKLVGLTLGAPNVGGRWDGFSYGVRTEAVMELMTKAGY